MRTALIFTAALLLAFALLVATFGYSTTKFAEFERPLVTFNGTKYSIPRIHFLQWIGPPDPLDEPDSLIFQAYLPNFSALPRRRGPGEPDGGRRGEVVVVAKKDIPVLTAGYAAIASERVEGIPFRDKYGLRTFTVKPKPRHPAHNRLAYYAATDQVVTVLIVCEPGAPSPPCTHEFNAGGIGFKLTYGMPHVAQWREIQDGIIGLMRKFAEAAQ